MFLFEAFNPTEFRVTKDGSDGGEAVLTVEGTGDDLLQAVALINSGFLFPSSLSFRVEYKLAPGARHVEIVTTVINSGNTVHPLPFLDPPELRDLGLDIPGLDQLSLSVPLGHFALFGGEQKVFATGPAGFDLRFAVEDSYEVAGGLPAFPGLVTEYVATRGDGVSYGVAAKPSDSNYANAFRDLYPGQAVTDHSLLVPFLFSAVVGIYSANPPELLLPDAEYSYSINVIVGGGDVGSVTDVIFTDIYEVVTGTIAGRIYDALSAAPAERASLILTTSRGDFVTQADVDAGGRFRVKVPPGDYQVQIVSSGREPSAQKTVTVSANRTTSLFEFLPPPGRVLVEVRDEQGRALPSRITLVSRFTDADQGRDPREFLYDLRIGESVRPTAFEPNRSEFIEKSYYSATGRFNVAVRPGLYDVVISRGTEYDVVTESVEIAEGSQVSRSVTLVRSVDTTGYVATDLHLHSSNSVDSGLSLADRVISIAGEGVEFAAATDHNFVTDYSHEIAKHDLQDWLISVVGLEITTFEMGHFNGYPLAYDSSTTRGGKFEWVGTPPDQIFTRLREMGSSSETVVQVNHPRWDFLGYFNVFNLDQDLGTPVVRQGLRSVFAPTGPEFELENFSVAFDAVEIINGQRYDLLHTYRTPAVLPPPPLPDPLPAVGEVVRDSNGQVAHPGAMEDWFALLNQGHRFTAVGGSDSHELLGDEPGYPRTYVFVGNDERAAFTTADVVSGIRSRNVTVSMGPFATIKVNGQPMGADVSDADGSVELEINVNAPNWSPFDKVIVWSNGIKILEYDVEASESLSFVRTENIALAADAWVLVEVTGSANLFPMVPPTER
ncbi:MAG: CehA/McbA family metallohydrolase, partial [Acidimicrobiales bacterium]